MLILSAFLKFTGRLFQGLVLAPFLIPATLLTLLSGTVWFNSSRPEVVHRPELVDAVRLASVKAANALPVPQIAESPVLVLPFANDPHGLVRDEVEQALVRRGSYAPLPPHRLDGWIDWGTESLGLHSNGITKTESACRRGRWAAAAVVMTGIVHQTRVPSSGVLSPGQSAYAEFTIELRDAHTSRLLHRQTFDNDIVNIAALTESAEVTSTWLFQSFSYLLLVLLTCLLWPLALLPLIRRVVRLERNELNAVLLVLLLAVPLLLSAPWIFGLSATWLRVLVMLPVTAAGCLWSVFVVSQISSHPA